MVATLIFLDRPLALTIWTHFRVGYNPIYVFRFVWVFDFPLSIHITIGRFMLLLSTFETEGIAAKAVDYLRWIDDSLCRVITLLSEWTPFNQLIIICKRLAVPSHILFEYFLIFIIGASFVEKLRINWMLYDQVASYLETRSFKTFNASVIDSLLEMFLPTPSAKLVTALHRNWRTKDIFFTVGKTCVAYDTVPLIFRTQRSIKCQNLILRHFANSLFINLKPYHFPSLLVIIKPFLLQFFEVPMEKSHCCYGTIFINT